MKRLIIKTLFIILAATFASCGTYPDVVQEQIKANDQDLPPELKGLKIYNVRYKYGDVKVAVLNNKVVSTTYPVGKHQESLIIVDNSTGKLIKVSQILSENDSLIVCRK